MATYAHNFSLQDDIVLGKKLGEGSFGAVYRVSLAKKPSSKVYILLFCVVYKSSKEWFVTQTGTSG